MITSLWIAPGKTGSEGDMVRNAVYLDELGWSRERLYDAQDTLTWRLTFLDEGEPVAFGRLSYRSLGLAELSQLAVLKNRRGEGLGDGLVKMLLLKAEGLAMKQAVVSCPPAAEGFFKTIEFTTQRFDLRAGQLEMRRELGIGFKCHCADQ